MTTNKQEVKRYDCTSGGAQHCYGCYTMKECELGDYVEWEAYEALQAECEKLRKDAERYRWMCDGNGYFLEHEMLCGFENEKAQADAAIDAAMQEVKP